MKTKTKWLAVLAVMAALTSAQTVRAITFGEPDGNLHPSVGAIVGVFHYETEDIRYIGGFSGTLIYKGQDRNGDWIGLFLTQGQSARNAKAEIDSGVAEAYVNFNVDPAHHPEQDIPVVEIRYLVSVPKDWAALDDVGIMVLRVQDPADLPEPAALARVGLLDELTQQQLQESQFVIVGYGASLLFPPPRPDVPDDWQFYEGQRQFGTPQYLNLVQNVVLLQANGPAGNAGMATGDHGGPLFMKDPTQPGHELLVAICEGANRNLNCVAWYYRVDTTLAQNFIKSIIDEL